MAVAVKASATIVDEDIALVPATAAVPLDTLQTPSWEAIKALVERHPGWRASLREANPVEQERGLVFSVDVSFSVETQARREAGASSASRVSVGPGVETVCHGADGASRTTSIPQGVKPFATRQKKRHNLASSAEDSPVKARVLHSFSPAVPLASARPARRAEDGWPAQTCRSIEEFHVLGGGGGLCKDSNSGTGQLKRKRDNRPTKTGSPRIHSSRVYSFSTRKQKVRPPLRPPFAVQILKAA